MTDPVANSAKLDGIGFLDLKTIFSAQEIWVTILLQIIKD